MPQGILQAVKLVFCMVSETKRFVKRMYGVPSSSSSAFPDISLGFTMFGEVFVYVTGFLLLLLLSNHRGSHIPSLWMMHARCIFVASIHLSRT